MFPPLSKIEILYASAKDTTEVRFRLRIKNVMLHTSILGSNAANFIKLMYRGKGEHKKYLENIYRTFLFNYRHIDKKPNQALRRKKINLQSKDTLRSRKKRMDSAKALNSLKF